MTKKENWLLSLIRKFRRILDTDEYQEYREFFPAFSGKITYVRLNLVKYYYGDNLSFYNSRIYENSYSDEIEVRSLYLNSLDNVVDPIEQEAIEMDNYMKENDSYIEPIAWDQFGNSIDYDYIYPIQSIKLPVNFTELKVDEFVKNSIDKEILKRLKILTNNIQIDKSKNRLSLIDKNSLNEIIDFLNQDWTTLSDDEKVPFFKKIFYHLGFETIPLEMIRNYIKFNFLNKISHPEIIVYDLNSNFILLLEELNKIKKQDLYKKDTIDTIIKKFSSFLPTNNRNINYMIVVNQPVTINLEHYKFEHRIVEKTDFSNELLKVFNPIIIEEDLHRNREISKQIEKTINYIKDKHSVFKKVK